MVVAPHPPFKVDVFVGLTRGSPIPIECTIIFNFEGGMARDSPEYVFAIRLVINDQCGLLSRPPPVNGTKSCRFEPAPMPAANVLSRNQGFDQKSSF